ncbi:sodium:proton antiporter [bacterium]|nr:sodium:proton antiporter [bacterium]
MTPLEISAVLLNLSALFLFINVRYMKLPTTVGLMLLSLVVAGVLTVLQLLGFEFASVAALDILHSIDLDETLLGGILCFLLFAGALHVDLPSLLREKSAIIMLATGGVVLSTFFVGAIFYAITQILGFHIPFIYCLVFGALISPTDAVTVLSFLKGMKIPPSIESKITGESLLNDGVGIVLFSSLLAVALYEPNASLAAIPIKALWDVVGGILFGLLSGAIAYFFIKGVTDYHTEIVATLALATGSFVGAEAIHASGPISVVAAGLLMGSHGRMYAVSEGSIHYLDTFWDLADEILNTLLFVIIGLELLAISTEYTHIAVALLSIPVVLAARYASILSVVSTMLPFRSFSRNISAILTWAGLRGGVSIALVLSLPAGEIRDVLVTATYFVVVFSVFVQGTTMRSFMQRLSRRGA